MAAAIPLLIVDPIPGAGARSKIFVVNDDSAVRVSLKFVFEAAGFEVRGFASGRGLLASPAIRYADGFVLDHKPRGADGLTLAKRLRARGLTAPIVLTTGLRSGAMEFHAAAVEPAIAASRVDEETIERLMRMIEQARGLRRIT
jgi:two-component system response regulator FixJ